MSHAEIKEVVYFNGHRIKVGGLFYLMERAGRIEYRNQNESDPVGYAVCSECGGTLENCDSANYCPWCGARLVNE